MKAGLSAKLACTVMLSTISVAVHAANASADWTWQRVAAPDRNFSVDLPCTGSEVDSAVRDFPPLLRTNYRTGTLVSCRKAGWFFSAGIFTASEKEATALLPKSIFDRELERLKAGASARGASAQPREIVVSGRRAFVVRTDRGKFLHEDGIVELSQSEIIIFGNLASKDQGADFASAPEVFDRFTKSLEVSPI